jgi:hypothetical protein
MENIAINIEDLYAEIKDRAFNEGAFTQEEWDDIVDQIIEEKREWTEEDDINWEEIADAMRARFDDFSAEIPEM